MTDTNDQAFVTFNGTRPSGADATTLGDGDLTVASFNVLNYFTTLGTNVAGCTSFNDRFNNPITVNSCPGTGARGMELGVPQPPAGQDRGRDQGA